MEEVTYTSDVVTIPVLPSRKENVYYSLSTVPCTWRKNYTSFVCHFKGRNHEQWNTILGLFLKPNPNQILCRCVHVGLATTGGMEKPDRWVSHFFQPIQSSCFHYNICKLYTKIRSSTLISCSCDLLGVQS